MRERDRGFLGAMVPFLICMLVVAGCGGSSGSTSRADVKAVAVAEREFSNAWRQASALGDKQCPSKGNRRDTRCFQRVAGPRQRRAAAEFSAAIEEVLASGVGSECADALKEAVAEIPAVPLFSGEATAACRAEFRGNKSLSS